MHFKPWNDNAQFQDRNELITGSVNALLLLSAAVIFVGGGKSQLVSTMCLICIGLFVSSITCPPTSMTVLIGIMPRIRNTEQQGTLEMLPKLSPTVFAAVVLVCLSSRCYMYNKSCIYFTRQTSRPCTHKKSRHLDQTTIFPVSIAERFIWDANLRIWDVRSLLHQKVSSAIFSKCSCRRMRISFTAICK